MLATRKEVSFAPFLATESDPLSGEPRTNENTRRAMIRIIFVILGVFVLDQESSGAG